jgi:hypothetical protein
MTPLHLTSPSPQRKRERKAQIRVFVAKKIRIDTNARSIVRGNKGALFGATKALCSGQQRRFVRGNKDALFGATKALCSERQGRCSLPGKGDGFSRTGHYRTAGGNLPPQGERIFVLSKNVRRDGACTVSTAPAACSGLFTSNCYAVSASPLSKYGSPYPSSGIAKQVERFLLLFIFALFFVPALYSQTEEADALLPDTLPEQPEFFRHELKFTVSGINLLTLSELGAGQEFAFDFDFALETIYEYNLTRDTGIGAYLRLSSGLKGFMPYYRKYPYSNDGKADGFFLGFNPSLVFFEVDTPSVDRYTLVGVGIMAGYKNSASHRLAVEASCVFTAYPSVLLDNQYVEPCYFGITVALGIRL